MTNSQDDTARWDAGIEKPSPETHEICATHTEDNRDHVGQMDDLDLRNTRAYKSDDSDGKVEFSWRNLIAAISLAGCYAAAQLPSHLWARHFLMQRWTWVQPTSPGYLRQTHLALQRSVHLWAI
jgi:hypothetical protein